MTLSGIIKQSLIDKFSIDELKAYAYHKNIIKLDKPIINLNVKLIERNNVQLAELEILDSKRIEDFFVEVINKELRKEKEYFNKSVKTIIFPFIIVLLCVAIPTLVSSSILKSEYLYSIFLISTPVFLYVYFKKFITNTYLNKFDSFNYDSFTEQSLNEYIKNIVLESKI